jgi:hypothetical protein
LWGIIIFKLPKCTLFEATRSYISEYFLVFNESSVVRIGRKGRVGVSGRNFKSTINLCSRRARAGIGNQLDGSHVTTIIIIIIIIIIQISLTACLFRHANSRSSGITSHIFIHDSEPGTLSLPLTRERRLTILRLVICSLHGCPSNIKVRCEGIKPLRERASAATVFRISIKGDAFICSPFHLLSSL